MSRRVALRARNARHLSEAIVQVAWVAMLFAAGCGQAPLADSEGDAGEEPAAHLEQALVTQLSNGEAADYVRSKCSGPIASPSSCNACVDGALGTLLNGGQITSMQKDAVATDFRNGDCNGTCLKLTCGALKANCGSASDACQGTLSCGACTVANGYGSCVNNVCQVSSCYPGFGNCNNLAADGCETDLSSNVSNCGRCGGACLVRPNAPAACVAGVCGIGPCNTGFANCNGAVLDGCEVNLTNNVGNCGACANACPALPNAVAGCSASQCVVSRCNAGFANCNNQIADGCEVSTSNNPSNCGACGKVCPAVANGAGACVDSVCAVTSCNTGWANCNNVAADGCECNLVTNINSCGKCGNVCPLLPNATRACQNSACTLSACNAGYGDCNNNTADGCEIDTTSSLANCGSCGHVCPALANASSSCVSSTCRLGACNVGFGNCDTNPANGCEVDITSNAGHCGACGRACAALANASTACSNSACVLVACNNGYANCNNSQADGCEINTTSNASHCGGCGLACPLPANGSAKCTGSVCGLGTCNAGFGNCDGNPGNGCETDTNVTVAHCGACGHACPSPLNGAPSCSGGTCGLGACSVGFGNCDNNPGNGCETDTTSNVAHCGGCGMPCPALPNATGSCAKSLCAIGSCSAGFADCDNKVANGCEIDSQNDSMNCGTCGHVCNLANASSSCAVGQCKIVACGMNFRDCNNSAGDGCEVAIATDPNNCGGCGLSCSGNNVLLRSCGGGVCNGMCTAGFADCNGNKLGDGCEISTATDANNCGGCGAVCSNSNMATRTCGGGACNGACAAGFTDCNNNKLADGCEISTASDANNCGGCGTVCSNNNMATRTCGAGACNGACAAGFADCNNNKQSDGCEIQTAGTDANNCGGCGTVCSNNHMATRTCGAGACNGACAAGFADCNNNKQSDGCEIQTAGTDANNCGGCGTVCSNNHMATRTCGAGACNGACAAGFADCNNNKQSDGCEIDITTTSNCGTCGNACVAPAHASAKCAGGACGFDCNMGWADCDGNPGNGCETDVTTIANCGTCNNACMGSQTALPVCTGGACAQVACGAGLGNCNNDPVDGCEQDIATDNDNCGSCGFECQARPHAAASCAAGVCGLGACNLGWGNCDGNAGNGCEHDVSGDVANCGSCGNVCPQPPGTLATCTAGVCGTVPACAPGTADCDMNPGNGCERSTDTDVNNCGSCGFVCSVPNATASCAAGACGVSSCNANFFNVDGAAGNGCECSATTNACGGATNLGTLAWGASTTLTGNVPGTQAQRWYVVAWGNNGASYHPHVTISTTGGAAVVFDLYAGGCAGLTATGCAAEGGSSTSRTDWEANQTAGDPSGGGTQGAFTWVQPGGIGQLAPGTALWIRVRGTNASSCSSFSLTVKNG